MPETTNNRTILNHSNTELVRYSDPHCTYLNSAIGIQMHDTENQIIKSFFFLFFFYLLDVFHGDSNPGPFAP